LLRRKQLIWGSVLFHVGVLVVFFGHLIGLLTPIAFFDMLGISHGAKQVLAIVAGGIFGAVCFVGLTMLLHCDLVYAAENAKFNFAFIDLGLLPEAASTYLLPRMLGYSGAAELLMLGEAFSADKARDCGLVNQVVAADELEDFAQSKAAQLAAKPPEALRQTKMMLRRGSAKAVEETMALELQMIGERLVSDEVRGIMLAFFARRGKAEN